ncbi:hypothetical protein BaRGS_00015323, partial [Batillaria attramentaria]
RLLLVLVIVTAALMVYLITDKRFSLSFFSVKPCIDPSCPVKFSTSPGERLRQILATRNRTIQQYLAAMSESVKSVAPSKHVIGSAASANHFGELKALIGNLKTHLFPSLSNLTFVIYDLGLSKDQRKWTEKNCGCKVMDFPFTLLPDFFKQLHCFAWKTLLIRTLIQKAEILIWLDSSIRFNATTPVKEILRRTRERGLQLFIPGWRSPLSGAISLRTDAPTFKFYGDVACQYESHGEVWGGLGFYHNEQFVREAVLDPWVSCAFDRGCMCLPSHLKLLTCTHKLPRQRSACHRSDQSSLGIIVSKLYRERTNLIRLIPGLRVDRGILKDLV